MPSPHGCSAPSRTPPPTSTRCSPPPTTKKPLPPEEYAMPDTPLRDPARATLAQLEDPNAFERRHIGPTPADEAAMLGVLGYESRDALIDAVVPAGIRLQEPLDLHPARHEPQARGA